MSLGRERRSPLYVRSPSPSSGQSTEVLQRKGVALSVPFGAGAGREALSTCEAKNHRFEGTVAGVTDSESSPVL